MVVVAALKVKPGKEKELEDAVKDMIAKVASEEGTLTYVFHRSQHNPGEFLMYEKYKDKAAFDHHGATPYFKELFGRIGPLLAGEPHIEMYEEVAAKK